MGTYIAQALLLWTRVIDLERKDIFKLGILPWKWEPKVLVFPQRRAWFPGVSVESQGPLPSSNNSWILSAHGSGSPAVGGGSVKPSLHKWKVLAATATNLINLIAHFCLPCSGVGLRVVAESLNSLLMPRDLPFLQMLLFAAPQCSGFSVSPVWCSQDASFGHNFFPFWPGMSMRAAWAGADSSWGQCLQCHCSNSSPNLGIFSFPAARDFFAMEKWCLCCPFDTWATKERENLS